MRSGWCQVQANCNTTQMGLNRKSPGRNDDNDGTQPQLLYNHNKHHLAQNTGYTQKNGPVSKVNKKFISHFTRAQRTPSAAATVQVSHALPAVRFSCLLRGQFPRQRRSRKRLPVCSVLRCPDL